MQIQTNSSQLNRNEYFKMITKNYFRKRLWLYSIIYVMFTLMLLLILVLRMPAKPSYIFFLSIAIWLPLYYIYWFWRYTGSKENAIFYRERTFKITDEFLEATLDDESFDRIRWQNILGYKKTTEGIQLFFSKQQFIYIPYRVFRCENDRKEFEAFILTNLKKAK